MNIIFIGDVVGSTGREAVFQYLPELKDRYSADFVIANGENAAGGSGITCQTYGELMRAGVDFLTMGNHVWSKKDIFRLLEDGENLIRPANCQKAPGPGYAIVPVGGVKLGILNLLGRVYMNPAEDPFDAADRAVEAIRAVTCLVVVDFHGEATSEKKALGYYLDGRVSAVIGTHTHIQTNDDEIFPGGTAYLTDAGMTGAKDSVLGIEKEIAIYKFSTGMPRRHAVAKGRLQLNGVFLKLDDKTGKALAIEKIRL